MRKCTKRCSHRFKVQPFKALSSKWIILIEPMTSWLLPKMQLFCRCATAVAPFFRLASSFRSSTPVPISNSSPIIEPQPLLVQVVDTTAEPVPDGGGLGPRTHEPTFKRTFSNPSSRRRRRLSELDERSQLLGEARGSNPVEHVPDPDGLFLRSIDTRLPTLSPSCHAANNATQVSR